MIILTNILELNKAIKNQKNLGFVPTMGGLHEGHVSLIKNSKKKANKTLVSIYVNPKQFNKKIDYKKYPRNIKKDLKILNALKVDYIYLPKTKQIYKYKRKKITLKNFDKVLCAKYRKGHFEGVLDIMDRFLNMINAKYVFMGEKDYQQLYLVKKFLKNKYKCKIISCPTIRNYNKLALSSRNLLLNKKNLNIAELIVDYLFKFKKSFQKRQEKNKFNLFYIKKYLEKKFDIKIEYLEFRNLNNLRLADFKKKYKLFIAYYIGGIRLIDNF